VRAQRADGHGHSPGPARRRDDSASHASAERSEGNGRPKVRVSAGPAEPAAAASPRASPDDAMKRVRELREHQRASRSGDLDGRAS
jgi:hypothetical protein